MRTAFKSPILLSSETAAGDKVSIQVDPAALDDLRQRVRNTRWPDEYANEDWVYGTNRAWLQSLLAYWADGFDWRLQESWLNSFAHYKSTIDGLGIHYIHQRSADPGALPLLLLHGWPGSFIQMLKLLPLLLDPAAHGLPSSPSFHVVVASLPGFGFSDAPRGPGLAMEGMAALMDRLMHDKLGYTRYGARGSDLGGTVIDQLGRHFPTHLVGIHLTQIIVAGGSESPADASDAERAFFKASAALASSELSYARQHASKPQTLAYGLNDSPVGLAAWITEKYRSWGDTGGNIESRFSKDFLLTTLSLYWFTETIGASARTYYEMARKRGDTSSIPVPSAFLMSQRDMFPPAPREWAARSHNVMRYNAAAQGGHFLEWEEPELVARDLQGFFRTL